MMEIDPVRRLLRERGCPEEVIAGGVEGLIADWERAVADVERGYPLGLDDYLNDLDARQLLEDTLPMLAPPDLESLGPRVLAADEKMKRLVTLTDECLWGERVADAEGWTPLENWWYFGLPRSPGPALRKDLEDE